jgi:hypothetical protein
MTVSGASAAVFGGWPAVIFGYEKYSKSNI